MGGFLLVILWEVEYWLPLIVAIGWYCCKLRFWGISLRPATDLGLSLRPWVAFLSLGKGEGAALVWQRIPSDRCVCVDLIHLVLLLDLVDDLLKPFRPHPQELIVADRLPHLLLHAHCHERLPHHSI
jgi:hypothetical protein